MNGRHATSPEAKPRQGDARFERLFARAPVMMHSVDRAARLLMVNDFWLATLGYARDEVVGRKLTDFMTPESRQFAENQGFPRFFAEGQVTDIPYRFVKKDGTGIDVSLSATAELDDDGNYLGSFAVLIDVTERNQVRRRLEEGEARARRMFEDAAGGVVLGRMDGRIVEANRAFREMLGYSESEILELSVIDLTHPDDRPAMMARRQAHMDGEADSFPLLKRYVHKDGHAVWVKGTASLLCDADGAPEFVLGQMQDITQERRIEEALRGSDEQNRRMFEDSEGAIVLVALDGVIARANPALCGMLGYTESELSGKTVFDITHPDDLAETAERRTSLAEGRAKSFHLEKRYLRKDGEAVWIRGTASLIPDAEGEPRYILGQFQDITERKALERQAEAERSRLRDAIESISDGVVLLDRDDRFVLCNSAYRINLEKVNHLLAPGTLFEDIVRAAAEAGLVDNAYGSVEDYVRQRMQKHRDREQMTVRFPETDRWMVVNEYETADGGIFHVRTDITEQKRLEEELRENQARFLAAIDNMNEGFALFDADDRLIQCNDRYLEAFAPDMVGKVKPGITFEEMVRVAAGHGFYDSWSQDPDRAVEERLARHRNPEGPMEVRRGDGRWFLFIEDRTPDGGTVLLRRDITERKQAEEELRESVAIVNLLRDTAAAANSAVSFEEAIATCLAIICRFTGWPIGHAFLLDETTGTLVPSGIWHRDDSGRAEAFARATGESVFKRGVGLPGRILESGQPAWIDHVTKDGNFPRAGAAAEAGLHGAFGFPVLSGDKVVAVLEFFDIAPDAPNDTLLPTVANIGTQLGRVFERKRAEETLRKAHDALEARVRERTEALSDKVKEHRRAEEALRASEGRLRSIMENIIEGILTIDADGAIESFNPAAEAMFGYAAGEVLGENVSVLADEPDRSAHDGYLRSYLDTGRAKIIGKGFREVRARRRDGSTFAAELAVSEMRHGPQRYFIGTLRDISERKEAELALLQAKERAELANRAKTEFLAHMSHELRTPLNAVLGYSDMLRGQFLGPLGNDGYLDYVGNIHSAGEHLLGVLSDILDVSKVEAGELEIEDGEVDIRETVADCWKMVMEKADLGRVALKVSVEPGLPRLRGDHRRLKQVLLNLLTNAIKFTRKRGTVTVTATLRDGGGIDLAVSDTGIGIAPKDIPRVLRPFGQVKEAYVSRPGEGSGLGLSLANALVELHGGTFTIESRPGEGTTVTAAFPPHRTIAVD